jgi:hypothetical protein
MGMILQTPRRTKEPYRLRKPRRSSATAQPTQQQAEKRGFARLTWEQPNNELYPGPCGRRHFRGKTRFTPVLCQKPFITQRRRVCSDVSKNGIICRASAVQSEVYPEVLCFGSERVRSTKLKAAVGKYTARKTQRGLSPLLT